MNMYRFSGSYREIGAEYGLVLRSERFRVPQASQTRLDFAAACEPFVRQHAPELLEELEGIAEGGGYDLDRINAAALGLNVDPACSVIAIAGEHTADGRTLFGRNFDWSRGSLHYAVFCHALPTGAHQTLSFTDKMVGRFGGLNDAGLAVGMASVDGGKDHPGIMYPLAVRMVLDRCATTAEAVETLTAIRHARAINILVADAAGDIASIEAHPAQVVVMRPADGCGLITNHFHSDAMARWEKVRKRPPDTLPRYRRLREWFLTRSAPLTQADLQAVLGAPKPAGVRMGDPRRRTTFDTIWSWTASLGEGSLSVAAGTPGDVPYRPYRFE